MDNEKDRLENEKDGLTEADLNQPEGVDVEYSSEVADEDDREAIERAEEADNRQLDK
ncbi:YfhD family protein [Fictibacillus fluitans]|uniref:YfhD family protein n=1 Tax=Fictibacillus fluitans TaxID=3058422 RepID=UPI003CD0D4B1